MGPRKGQQISVLFCLLGKTVYQFGSFCVLVLLVSTSCLVAHVVANGARQLQGFRSHGVS